MFFGIEESTDMRHRGSVVKRFTTKASALRWKNEKSGGFTYPGAATNSILGSQQNWHHTFRYIYESRDGFRLDMRVVNKRRDDAWKRMGYYGGTYGLPTSADIAISMIRKNCEEVKEIVTNVECVGVCRGNTIENGILTAN